MLDQIPMPVITTLFIRFFVCFLNLAAKLQIKYEICIRFRLFFVFLHKI